MRLEVVDELDEPMIEFAILQSEVGERCTNQLSVLVLDVQDAPEDLMVSFASDLDGEFCVPTPDDIGFAACEGFLVLVSTNCCLPLQTLMILLRWLK